MRNFTISARTSRGLRIAVSTVLLALPMAVAAQSMRPLGSVTLQIIIGRVVNTILGVLGSLSLVMFMYGGIVWMTAAGNDEKIKKAKSTIVYAVLGLIVTFLSYNIVMLLIWQTQGQLKQAAPTTTNAT